MKFYPLSGDGNPPETELREEYENARAIGGVRFGEARLYVRRGRKIGHIPYADIGRCYRRVLQVPLRMCCGSGDLEVENLVVEGAEGELAQVQLPGRRAAEEAMRLLRTKLPEDLLVCPAKAEAGAWT